MTFLVRPKVIFGREDNYRLFLILLFFIDSNRLWTKSDVWHCAALGVAPFHTPPQLYAPTIVTPHDEKGSHWNWSNLIMNQYNQQFPKQRTDLVWNGMYYGKILIGLPIHMSWSLLCDIIIESHMEGLNHLHIFLHLFTYRIELKQKGLITKSTNPQLSLLIIQSHA